MIIYIGGRTDIVHFYLDWLIKRFKEGYVLVRNPLFPGKVTRYELAPDKVDAVVLTSRNFAPILDRLSVIADHYSMYYHYIITAYGKEMEPGVPSIQESIRTLIELEQLVGSKRIAWRYDPVFLTDVYTEEKHLKTFERIAKQLTGHVDRCILGYLDKYDKVKKRMPELRALNGENQSRFLCELGRIAADYKIPIQACAARGDYSRYGITPAGCLTLDMIGEANGLMFKNLKHKGNRPGCQNIESRDIGAYHTCLNGCKYCADQQNPKKVQENCELHDPESPLLVGYLRPGDTVQQGIQKSFRQ